MVCVSFNSAHIGVTVITHVAVILMLVMLLLQTAVFVLGLILFVPNLIYS